MLNKIDINSAQVYFTRLTDIYLDSMNDENSKSTSFRTVLEDFFHDYLFPEEPETMSLNQLQRLWAQGSGNHQLNRFIDEIRVDLNHITHGDKNIRGNRNYLSYLYRCCVAIIINLSEETPDIRTRSACGEQVRNYLDALNEQQRDIVIDDSRVVYVNAGPGTGKTHLLVYKIVDLLYTMGKDAKIVALSYTRTSARSLTEKLSSTIFKLNLIQESVPYSGTIHSFCLNSLRAYWSKKGNAFDYVIADDSEIDEMVDEIYYSFEDSKEDSKITREEIKKAIKKPDSSDNPKIVAAIAQRKDAYKRISVGEILNVYLKEILNNDEFVAWSRENMNVILVDEAQDLTVENYNIFDVLLEKIPELKLFLVGDPRQNIFGFLGGSFSNLNDFLEKYDDQTSRKALNISYRCPQVILDFTNTMVFRDCENIQLRSNSEEPGSVSVKDFEDEYVEAERIVAMVAEHASFDNTAILSPKIKMLAPIVDELNAKGIRFVVQGGSNSLKPYIHAISCMNRLVETDFRTLGTANKLCARLELPKCRTLSEFLGTEIGMKLHKVAKRYKDKNISFVQLEREFVKLCREAFPDSDVDEMNQDFRRLNDLVIRKSNSPRAYSFHFKHWRKQFIAPEADFKSIGTSEEAVTLSTIHSAKGLEWDYVFMPCMCDHLFSGSSRQDSIEQEDKLEAINTDKKLLFVAVTRAKRELIVSYPTMMRDSRQQTRPSRLLGSLILM